jgi:hypothetical protein
LAAFSAETTRGWSGAVAYRHAWTPTLSSNVFLTRLNVTFPRGPVIVPLDPRFIVTRVAANLVWELVTNISATVELGLMGVRARNDLTRFLGQPGRSWALQTWLSRVFSGGFRTALAQHGSGG